MNNAALLLRESAVELEHRDAMARPRTFDTANNSIEAIVATGTPVARRDTRGTFLEILDAAGADLDALRGASVLDGHQQGGVSSILGTVEDAWREGDVIAARLRLSTRPDVAPVVNDIREGVIASVSIGYVVSEWRDGTDASGQRTRTAVKWVPKEISFVPVPADSAARTRSANNDDRAIRELGRRAGVSTARVDALLESGASIDDAHSAFLNEILDRGVTVRSGRTEHNMTTLDNPEFFQRAAADALYARISPSHQPTPQARQYVNMSCADMARECLHRAGVATTGMSGSTLITRGLQSTSDYPALLSALMGKSLRDAYQVAPSGIRQIARERSAPDFRAMSRIQVDHSGFTLGLVSETAEFPMGAFVDTAESYSIKTYGKIFTISRQALVNDDLGGLGDVTRRLGLAAAEFERQKLVDLFELNSGAGPTMSDGNALFHSSHSNIAPTGAAPSATSLSAARLLMRSQTGPGGGLISVVPAFLVVPSSLETIAEQLAFTLNPIKVDDVNPFAATLTPIVEPRLVDQSRWYVAAAPELMPAVEYAYLSGASGPQTESRAGFEVDGVSTKVRLDYGCSIVEHRSLVTNPGA